MQMSGIGDMEYEKLQDDRITDGVEFDTDGITENCPRKEGIVVIFDECERCPDYLGSKGFIVYCYAKEQEE